MSEMSQKFEKTAGDEKSINFRPSPNFKHMKKYLKYKFEGAGCTGHFTPTGVEEPHPAQHADQSDKVKITVQPPLLPNSPPPDCPPNLVLKKEIEDDEYENNSVDKSGKMDNEEFSETEKPKPTDEPCEKPRRKKKIMCKDFIRGQCKSQKSCKYAHELDLAQLKGIYTFCHDFANGKCKRVICYFVHASNFEKENFFRTGYLPPHTLNNPKKTTPGHGGRAMPGIQPVFVNNSNTQGELPTSDVPPLPVMAVTPTARTLSVEPKIPPEVFQATQPVSPTELNGDSNTEPPAKKCIQTCTNCKIKELRYQQLQSKLEALEKVKLKFKEKMVLIDQKREKLTTLMALLDSMPD